MPQVRLIGAIAILVILGVAAWLTSRGTAPEENAQLPVPFGYRTGWYAVRSEDAKSVAFALSLTDIHPNDWKTGTKAAVDWTDGQVFVTPPVKGWVFAEGAVLLSDGDRDRRFENRLVILSNAFGEAQYFASARVNDGYVWARAENGFIDCVFKFSGGNLYRAGREVELEKELGLNFFDAGSVAARDPAYFKRSDLTYPNEDDVLRVANAWSLSPVKLDVYPEARIAGFIGRYHP